MMAHTSYVGWSGEVILEASSWKGPYKVVGSDLIDHCEYCEEGASHAYHHYVAHHHNIPRYTIMYIINACVLSLSRFLAFSLSRFLAFSCLTAVAKKRHSF